MSAAMGVSNQLVKHPAVLNALRMREMSLSQASSFYTLDVTLHSEPSVIDVSPSHCQSDLTSTPPFSPYFPFQVTAASNTSKYDGQDAIQIKGIGPINHVV